MKNESLFDLDKIQAYLKGELKEKELTDFEKEIQENEELKEAIAFSEDIQFALEHRDLIKANDYLSSLKSDANELNLQENNITNLLKKWGLGILGVLLLGSLVFWGLNSKSISPIFAVEAEVQQYQDLLYTFDYPITFSEAENDLKQLGHQAFLDNDYLKATNQFGQALKEEENFDVRLLLSISILRGDLETMEAIEHLELLEIQTSQNREYDYMQSYLHWFLGLAYMKQEQYDNANRQFEYLKTEAYFKDKLPEIKDLLLVQ